MPLVEFQFNILSSEERSILLPVASLPGNSRRVLPFVRYTFYMISKLILNFVEIRFGKRIVHLEKFCY